MFTTSLKFITSRKSVMISTLAIILTCGTLWLAGQDPESADDSSSELQLTQAVAVPTSATEAAPGEAETGAKGGKPKLSEAQRIARLERTIEADNKELTTLVAQGDSPDDDYHEAETEFQEIDVQWTARRKQLEDLRRGNRKAEADQLAADSEDLQNQWQAAKDRFDLAINKRKTLREKAAALQQKIQQDKRALDALVGNDTPTPPPPASEAPTEPSRLTSDGNPPGALSNAPPPATTGPEGPAAPMTPPEVAALPSPSPLSPVPPAAPAPITPQEVELPHPAVKPSHELAQAQKEAELRKSAAQEAEHHVESVNERFEGLRKNIALEQQLLDLARATAEQAQAARTKLDKELQQTLTENPAGLVAVWEKIDAADKRHTAASAEVRRHQQRLDELREELSGLQDEQLAALGKAKQTHDEAAEAEGRLAHLQNPFTPMNLVQWFLDHGPKLLAILVGTLLLSLMVKLSGRQIAQVVARGGSRGTARDRENRAITLVSVFRNTSSIILVTGGLLMALDEIGIPIAPLMGGAAVLGLAIAFGAQNLIRDYFSGFMVLLEDQYGINDVVKIGELAGSVEKITLRMTVLRDLEGSVHFIPHGSITSVTNMTHGWSRAVVDIGVAYKESADRVMQVLVELGREMRKDPTYGPLILDGPEMLGLDSLGDSAVVFKFFLKTQPLQRWFVRRELLRRIKNKFDELGIEIPFPQRTIHYHHENGDVEPHDVGIGPSGGSQRLN